MDPFDDIFAPVTTNVRAGGKFQPKGKQRPKKAASISAPSVVPSDTTEKKSGLSGSCPDAGLSTLPTNLVDERLHVPDGSCLASSEVSGTGSTLIKCEELVSRIPEGLASEKSPSEGGKQEDLGCVDVVQQEGGVKRTDETQDDGVQHLSSSVDFVGIHVDHFIDCSSGPSSNARGTSEQRILMSAPSEFPDAAKEKLGTDPATSLGAGESAQLSDVGKPKAEVDRLQFTEDPFGDILSESTTNNARAGQKFRPKINPQPQKGAATGVASALPDMTKSPTAMNSVDSLESIHIRNSTIIDGVDSSLRRADIFGNKDPPGHEVYPSSSISLSESTRSLDVGNLSQSQAIDNLQVDKLGSQYWHSSFGKSLGETADIFSGLEYLDDFVPQTASSAENNGSKSMSKVDIDVHQGEKFLPSICRNNDLRGSTPSEMGTHPVEDFSAQANCSFEPSEFTICDVGPSQTSSHCHTEQDPVTFSETPVSNNHEAVQVDNGSSDTKVASSFFYIETCDASVSGQRAVKFKPKPKLGKGKDKFSANDSQAEVRSSLPSEAVDVAPFNNERMQESCISEFPAEDAFNCSSSRLADLIYPTPEIQGDAEPANFTEAPHSEDAVLGDIHSEYDFTNVDGGNRAEEVSTESNCLRKGKRSSTISEEVEDENTSKRFRKRLKPVIESVGEVHDTDDPMYEPPSASNIDEMEDNDGEHRMNTTSRRRKAPRKVKEPVTGSEKPVRKRKTSKKSSDELAQEPPKKFSHSSRRNKRRVDQALLDTPEDEIDPQRLPIRDLIILAEHRERMMIKDAAKLKTPETNQSADNSFHDGASRNEEDSLSERGQYSDEDQPSDRIQATSVSFNYQTYMKKTPSTRWSKQETELFYQAVRQFGTDFSLIQQLFPNRTRHQVKLKFKKEERQNPLQLSEAATNRAKDHSYFESVIERLQQQAAGREKQESYGNDPVAATGEEGVEDTANDTNDGAEKPPERDDEVVKEQEAEVVEVHNSPVKFDESDDDPDRWNEY